MKSINQGLTNFIDPSAMCEWCGSPTGDRYCDRCKDVADRVSMIRHRDTFTEYEINYMLDVDYRPPVPDPARHM